MVVIDGSVALEIFESSLGSLEPTRYKDAIATTKSPPRVGFRRCFVIWRSQRALQPFLAGHDRRVFVDGGSHAGNKHGSDIASDVSMKGNAT